MRNKWRRKLRCFGTFVLMLSCLCFHRTISAYASPAERGTIQIDVKVEDKKDNRVGIENVKFLLYHIADWETDRWVLKPNFADFTGKLDFSDAKEQEKTSRELSEYIRKKAFREIIGTSNASGIVMFTNLEQGIYLVAQEQSFRYDIYTYTSTPSLVQVPARIGDQDYLNVELEMKFSRTEDEPDRPSSSNKKPKPETVRDDPKNPEIWRSPESIWQVRSFPLRRFCCFYISSADAKNKRLQRFVQEIKNRNLRRLMQETKKL